MKIIGATAAAAMSSGIASADWGAGYAEDSDPPDWDENETDYLNTNWMFGLLNPTSPNDSPTADEISLHLQIRDEPNWYDDIGQVQANYLEDSSTAAHVSARDGIATTWQNGGTTTEAYDEVLARIRDYYAVREVNEITAMQRVLIQYAHYVDVARANDSVEDGLLTLAGEQGDGTNAVGYLTADFQMAGFELVNGEFKEVQMPHVEWIDNTGTDPVSLGTELLTPAILTDGLDPTSWPDTEFTMDVTDDSGTTTTITFGGSFNLMNLPDADDEEYPGVGGVFELGEFIERRDEIISQSDTVQANYDETFIQSFYGLLDDGTVDPADVRGPIAQAEYMGGSSDAYADSYRIALMQQFGLDRSDLSQIASMTVSYSGSTRTAVETSGSTRNVFPRDFVTEQEHQGLLYARDTPEQGIVSGETLAAENIVLSAGGGGDNDIQAHDLQTGSHRFDLNIGSTGVSAPPAVDSNYRLYAVDGSETIAYDLRSGDELWRVSAGSNFVFLNADETQAYTYDIDTDELVAIDTDTGAVNWRYSQLSWIADAVELSDGSLIIAGGDVYTRLDPSNQTEMWSHTHDGDGSYIFDYMALADDEAHVYLSTPDGIFKWDTETGGVDTELYVRNVGDFDIAEHDGTVVAVDGSTIIGYDEMLSEQYNKSADSNLRSVAGSPNAGELYVGTDADGIHPIEVSNGYLLDALATGADWRFVPAHDYDEIDGFLSNPIFYDATASEEIDMAMGSVEIIEQTDGDGNIVEQSDVDQPEYGTNNANDWAKEVERTTTVYKETIVNNYDSGGGGGGIDLSAFSAFGFPVEVVGLGVGALAAYFYSKSN